MLSKFILVSETRFQNTETTLKNQQASIQGLETQIGQLSKLISERPQGSLPSNTEPNPREQLNAISAQDKEGFITLEPELQQDNAMNKGREEVNNNDPKQVSTNHEPRVTYPKVMTKDRTKEQFGDDSITLEARDSVKTSKTQDNAIKTVDDKTNIQSSLQELPRTKTTEIVRYYHEENKDVHEERRLQIEELDEWREHKPRTYDKPKLCKNKPDTSPNQLKVGNTVLLDAVDPHIVTTTSNEKIPLTVLSIFPFDMVEVSHPKFGTLKAFNVIFKRKENRRTSLEEEKGSIILRGSNRGNSSPSPTELFSEIIELTYLELTMELCSTFHLQTVMTRYDDPGTVQFHLGRLIHQLSVPEFGATLRLYTEEFREENELHALSHHIHFSPSKCWHTLAPSTALYNPSHSKASVLPPSLKYFHAILAHTITGSPRNSAPDRAASEEGYLHCPLRDQTGATLRAPQHCGPRIILHPHRPDVSTRHLEHA
ncbi:hypothetical protein GOBAR_AA07125 [Gossypium barbadense]|uniref:Uncharacterized protein n=1 Tax=Gossypium barbadense TaxID=3634 RepID=A0A2P5YD45_GOSBA|nr:hypothetical protein GOBAR_AA07125 [Gossypium barbadense]